MQKLIKLLTSRKVLVLLDQALVSAGNFVLGVLLARWLGMAAFGEYSLLWMGVLFALSLHQAWLTQPLATLFAGKKPDEQSAYLQSLSVLQGGLAGALAVLSLMVYLILKNMGITAPWAEWLPLGGLLAGAYLSHDFFRKVWFVKQRFRQPLLMDTALYGTVFPLLFVLHSIGRLNLEVALWAMLPCYLLGIGVGIFYLQKEGLIPSLGNKKAAKVVAVAKEHYHYSYWLLGTSLVQWFSGNFFLLAAAGVLGAVAVGALRMAQNLVGLCHVLFLAMENVVPAEAARRFFSGGESAMLAYLRQVSWQAGVQVVLLLAVLSLVSPWLIGVLYGAEYQSFSWVVGAYSVLYVFVYLGFPLRFALRALNYTSPIFIAYSLSALASLLLAYPMVKSWGALGVMGGLIGAQVLLLLVYGYFIFNKLSKMTLDFR